MRKVGRPPLDSTGAGTRVSVRLTAVTYDALYRVASEDGVDVAVIIRQAINDRLIADRRADSA